MASDDSDKSKTGRLVAVTLDEASIGRTSRDVEHERAVAIYDLIEENSFRPGGHDAGPYALNPRIDGNRLVFDIRLADGAPVIAQIVALRENPEVIDVPLPAADTIRARLGALSEQLAVARRDHTYPRKPPNAAACHALGCGYVARCWGH